MVAGLLWRDYVRPCCAWSKGIWGKACGWQTGAYLTGKHTFFSPLLLPATKPHHVLFPSWSPYPQFILTPVHRHVVFLPPNLSVPLRFKVQVSVFWSANPFSLCHSCLFLFPSPLLTFHTYSIAVSSLSTFHLPIPTFIRSFWGFFLFVCPMFFLFWHRVCSNPCCNPPLH